jgi:hypothetical protein
VRLPTVADRPARLPPAQALIRYFRRLWSGELPLSQVFWRDMLVVGTLINLATLLAAMLIFASGAPPAYGVAVFLSPIPYNVVLFTGVCRSAAHERSEWGWAAQMIAVVWLIVGFLI